MFLQSANEGILLRKCPRLHIEFAILVKKCLRLHIEFAILVKKCPRLHAAMSIFSAKFFLEILVTSVDFSFVSVAELIL